MISLDPSTCVTFRHILHYLSLHSRLPKILLQVLVHLICSGMDRIPRAMISSLMVGIRAMLFNAPCGTIQRLDSAGSQQEVRGWTMILLQWCLWLNASATTFVFWGNNGSSTHSPLSILTTFIASYLNLPR
jgi:hypothetical protein